MPDWSIEQLALEGHGAIQVDAAVLPPVKVFLAGPIKYWWSLPQEQWETGVHAEYLELRSAVEAALVKEGYLVFSPHKAWRGSWHNDAQLVNDFAIQASDVVVAVLPEGIPAEGTYYELGVAASAGKPIFKVVKNDIDELYATIDAVNIWAEWNYWDED